LHPSFLVKFHAEKRAIHLPIEGTLIPEGVGKTLRPKSPFEFETVNIVRPSRPAPVCDPHHD
jgi:hypothetical protein